MPAATAPASTSTAIHLPQLRFRFSAMRVWWLFSPAAPRLRASFYQHSTPHDPRRHYCVTLDGVGWLFKMSLSRVSTVGQLPAMKPRGVVCLAILTTLGLTVASAQTQSPSPAAPPPLQRT